MTIDSRQLTVSGSTSGSLTSIVPINEGTLDPQSDGTYGAALGIVFVSYGNTDHHVKTVEGEIDSVALGSENTITVGYDIEMDDASGHSAVTSLTAIIVATPATT